VSNVSDSPRRRGIRSFVVRAGRITAAQERALQELWPRYGIDAAAFARRAPLSIEIGFGNGEQLAALAAAHPERNYLGIEVHRPGVGRLMLLAEEQQFTNLRIAHQDAVEVLRQDIASSSVDEILILFPDPWHKKRHHKRRLIQPEFAVLLADRLKPGGLLRLATDWQEYAEEMRLVLDACAGLHNNAGLQGFIARPAWRLTTRFERRGQRLGHGVWDLEYQRA
jgi:tRNA (guanine-N7-)-methyltransferase